MPRCGVASTSTMNTSPAGVPDQNPAVFLAVDVGMTVGVDGALTPTVVIDTSGHPEVADLARVHAVDGVGDVTTAAVRSASTIVLGVRLTTPVVAAFAVAFDAGRHAAFLDDVAAAGVLTFATTDPATAAADEPLWLAVDIDGEALRAVLAES